MVRWLVAGFLAILTVALIGVTVAATIVYVGWLLDRDWSAWTTAGVFVVPFLVLLTVAYALHDPGGV